MSEQTAAVSWTFQGGYATDLAPEVKDLKFLTRAENAKYEVSGSVRKFGGASRLNSVQLDSGANITGMFDAYYQGTGGSQTRRYINLTSAGNLYTLADNGDTVDITGGATTRKRE